jgi:toxin ParE1/3/4
VAHKFVCRAAAVVDLTALYDYIASESSSEIAIGYIRRIQEACMGLATFPERGRRHDDIWPGLRVIGFERRVSIAFRVLKTRVEIVTIDYGGWHFERELRKGKRSG